MLDDYCARDLVFLLDKKLPTKIYIALGGKSNLLNSHDRDRVADIAQRNNNIYVRIFPHAGHYVHIDSPQELLSEILVSLIP
jgi:esterase